MIVSRAGYRGYYDPGEDHCKVVFGQGSVASLPEEIAGRRALLVASKSLAEQTDFVSRLTRLLGRDLVGVFTGSALHTPRTAILEAAEYARSVNPDVILSFGGGSHTDTCKALRLALWLDLRRAQDFDEAYSAYRRGWTEWGHADLGRSILPQIGIPTTLISAEHTQGVGVTDPVTHAKQVFSHPDLQSQVVFLDPDLSTATPSELWLSTGVKALEHAIAKLAARERDPVIEAIAGHAVALLASDLPRSSADPSDLAARGNLLIASWLCMFGSWSSLVKRMGLSHALGRQVGGVSGASHGLISGVLLPYCIEFNAPDSGGAIRLAAEAFGLDARRMDAEAAAIRSAEAVRELVRSLGLPQTLRAIGVRDSDLRTIAQRTMDDMSVSTNPRQLRDADEVLDLLQKAW